MSKKYECIKNYPGVSCGAKAFEINDGTKDWYSISYNGSFIFNQHKSYFNNEFWEEIKENEWEIVEGNMTVVTVQCDIEGIQCASGCEIKSIKRLSDNTIFTIGDKIKSDNPNCHAKTPEAITKIQLNKDGNPCLFTNSFSNNGVNIFKAVKCEKLFITEDGVDIYYGDSLYWLNVKGFIYEPKYSLGKYNWSGCRSDNDAYKWFSTKQKAEEYIAKSKPILTTVDGVDIKVGDECYWIYKLSFQSHGIHGPINLAYSPNNSDLLFFSTKEAAQKYIDENKVYFTTKDGYPIRMDDIYYLVIKDNFTLSKHSMNKSYAKSELIGDHETHARFKLITNAERYIELNKKRFSLQDLKDCEVESGINYDRKLDKKNWYSKIDTDKLNLIK